MNNAYLAGYKKKNVAELISAIDACTSLSQLFALIQHEQIEIQMHAQSGASNLQPRKLNPKEMKELPLDRLKAEVKKAVVGAYVPEIKREEDSKLIGEIQATQTLSELFALIQREHIVVQMHSQPGASNLKQKKLEVKRISDKNKSPFERFKAEVIKSLTNR